MFYEADAPLPPSSVKGRKTGITIIIRVSVKSGSVRKH